jgi:hypothetical protein
VIAWENIKDVGGADIDDEGQIVPLFVVGVFDRSGLPDNPWGARWVDDAELGILAEDWGRDPQQVAEKVADYAVEAVGRSEAEARAELGQESWWRSVLTLPRSDHSRRPAGATPIWFRSSSPTPRDGRSRRRGRTLRSFATLTSP